MAASGERTIVGDVACDRCGYNLRTQPVDAVCPECGEPVERSLCADRVRTAELGALRVRGEPWLRATRRGLDAALLARVAGTVAAFVLVDSVPPYSSLHPSAAAVWLSPFVVAFVAGRWTLWLLARPYRAWLRIIVRFIACTDTAWLAMLFLNARFGRYYFPKNDGARGMTIPLLDALPRLGSALSLCTTLAAALIFARLVHVAWRARQRTVAIWIGLCGLATITFDGLCWMQTAQDSRFFGASSEYLAIAPSPSGVVPVVGLIVANFGYLVRYAGRRGLTSNDLITIALAALAVAMSIGLGLALLRLRWIVSRAIRLERRGGDAEIRTPDAGCEASSPS